MASRNRGACLFPDCGSQTSSAKKNFLMMPPEKKLQYFESQAQAHEDNQEFDACIQDLVHCVALTVLAYGEQHLKLAEAHTRLAKAYFQFKGWGLQAQKHSTLAREMLSFLSTSSNRGEKILICLLNVNLTQGGAFLLTDNLLEAEFYFLEAEQILKELHECSVITQEEKIKTQLEISSGLYRVYKRQNKPKKALSQCVKSLQLLMDCGNPERTCSIYRDMATIEQDQGHLEQAIEHLSKAHAIAMSHGLEELEGAQISHSLALIFSAAAESHHNDSAGHYFEQSLKAYRNSVGPQDPAFLAAQDDFCHFLLNNGQKQKCIEIQRASLDFKRSAFGELSAEVADTLQLIGSVELTEGRMTQAHRTLTKCLKIQSLLYGRQHEKTKAVQRTVDMLARAPEVAEKIRGKRKTKPHTFPLVPASGNN